MKGTRLGHKGKKTHFYSVVMIYDFYNLRKQIEFQTAIETYLGLKVIVSESVEDDDFNRE